MKTRMQRWLTRVALSLLGIAAWGTGAAAQSLSGVYGGEECDFKLTFRGMDVVYIQFIAGGSVMQELPGHYKVDGDKVSVTAPNWGAVFTRKGDTLKTPYLGGTAVCTKPPGVGNARPQVARAPIPMGLSSCDEFSWAYNRDNVCFDTRPILLTPTSKAKGSLGNPHSWSPQSQGALTLTVPAEVSVTPWPVLLLLKVSRDGRTLEAKAWYSSNVKTFNDAAVDMVMAKNLRWKPAQKNGEAVEALVLLEVQPALAGPSGFISVNVTGGDELGNSVYIDRVFIGNPPPVINYQVRAGPHTIHAMIKGPPYREVNDTVQVVYGGTVVKSYGAVAEEEASGFITVNVSEGPSVVYIDNQQMDTVPVIHYKVSAGPHRIQALIRGRTVNETVQVESGATVVKSYGAVAAGAIGFISVNVTGAPAKPRAAAHPVVAIDNVNVGRTPVINYQVRAGPHTIWLKVGARFVFDTVQVDSGATVVKSYEATPR